MKQLLNMLSHVWNAYRAFNAIRSAWEFLRDHFDDFL